MGCPIYSINKNGWVNGGFLVLPGMDLFNHAFQICCPVNSVLDAKNQCLAHYLHVIDTDKLFNVLKLIPYVPGLIMTYL